MAKSAQASQWTGYASTVTMLVLALLFPVGLMIFNPTLMFERGWEQYVGTGIYFWAVVTLSRELWRLWHNERAFDDSPALLKRVNASIARGSSRDGSQSSSVLFDDDDRMLPLRIRQLMSFSTETGSSPSVTQLMEVNRESSGLDQEQMAGRFTLTRYILYLLPVIGFIGTVRRAIPLGRKMRCSSRKACRSSSMCSRTWLAMMTSYVSSAIGRSVMLTG